MLNVNLLSEVFDIFLALRRNKTQWTHYSLQPNTAVDTKETVQHAISVIVNKPVFHMFAWLLRLNDAVFLCTWMQLYCYTSAARLCLCNHVGGKTPS